MTPTAEVSAQGVARLEASPASIDKQLKAYEAKLYGGQEVPLVRAFATENANLFKEGFEPALVALRAADPAKVQQLLVEKIRPQFLSAQQALTQLVSLHLDAAKRQIEEATARYRMIQNIATTAVVSGLLFSVCFGFALIRAIGRQLGGEPWEAAAVAQRVAAGELNTSIQIKAGDRTSLMTHLKAMQEGLTELVKRVRANSDCVATATSQIAGGNGDLSVRTEQQASALQETAASVQELTAAVTRNADSALQANQLARAASGLAGTNRWRSAPAAAVRSGPGCATGLRRDDLTISTHNSPSRHRIACIAPTSARRASRRCGRLVHPSSCAASTSHTASSRSAPASPRCPRSGAAPRAEARSSGLQPCMSHRARSHAKCPPVRLLDRFPTDWSAKLQRTPLRSCSAPPGIFGARESCMVSLAQWPPLRRIGSRTRVAGLVAIGICTAACIDWITGESIVVISLYFVPLALAGARLGMRGALAAAVLASVAWLAVQHATDERFATATISGLNLITQGAAFLSVAFLFARLNESLRRERLRGRLDALTGIGNRQAFIDQASAALALCRRHRHAASVATIDLPALGSEIEDVNASADAVLRRCGQLIGWTLRESDIAGRINATRFAVFFPETSVADAAWPLERLRYVLESADDMEGLDIHMQTTIVPNGRPPAALADLLGRAERARAA